MDQSRILDLVIGAIGFCLGAAFAVILAPAFPGWRLVLATALALCWALFTYGAFIIPMYWDTPQ